MIFIRIILFVLLSIALMACSWADKRSVRLNQLGFYTKAKKQAVVVEPEAPTNDVARIDTFTVVSETKKQVYKGKLSDMQLWPYSDETVRLADFSSVTKPGRYRIHLRNIAISPVFEISDSTHKKLNKAALKAFYYNRSGMALDPRYARRWARAVGHPDTNVVIHATAATDQRPEGSKISSPMGWYDAGDYNKYVVNSGIATFTLLAAYEHFSQYYDKLNSNIPESQNTLPDILDEALWNIRWLLTMQDPNDGGVYHKLTNLKFEGRVMPADAQARRYVVQKSTTAALNFAATMAVASRIFSRFDSELAGFSKRCHDAAERAWVWANNNPNVAYVQPKDVATGTYSAPGFDDEFAWAAAELYISFADETYYRAFERHRSTLSLNVPSWSDTLALGYISLIHHSSQLADSIDIKSIRKTFLNLANNLRNESQKSAYGIAMGYKSDDFVWGSNAVALNQSMVLIQAYQDTNDASYLDAAMTNLDYVMGRNAVGYSFVTGFGAKSPVNIHHRPSYADGIFEPIPGLLIGGPHSGQQDGCSYPSLLPAKSYLNEWCSYSTNEIAINWNAPLVYVSGAFEAIY